MIAENVSLTNENFPTPFPPPVDFLSGKLYILGESRNIVGQGEVEITFATKSVRVDDLNIQPSPILRYEIEQYFSGRSIHTTNQQEQILIFTTTMPSDIGDYGILLQKVKNALLQCLVSADQKSRALHDAARRESDDDL